MACLRPSRFRRSVFGRTGLAGFRRAARLAGGRSRLLLIGSAPFGGALGAGEGNAAEQGGGHEEHEQSVTVHAVHRPFGKDVRVDCGRPPGTASRSEAGATDAAPASRRPAARNTSSINRLHEGERRRRPSLPVPAPRVPFSADLINELLTGPDRETIAGNRGKTWAAMRPVCRRAVPGLSSAVATR